MRHCVCALHVARPPSRSPAATGAARVRNEVLCGVRQQYSDHLATRRQAGCSAVQHVATRQHNMLQPRRTTNADTILAHTQRGLSMRPPHRATGSGASPSPVPPGMRAKSRNPTGKHDIYDCGRWTHRCNAALTKRRFTLAGQSQVQMWASPRCRRGPVPGADVGQSRCRCGQSRCRCGPVPAQR